MPHAPGLTEEEVVMVVGHGCVQVAHSVAHESVLHGPKVWHPVGIVSVVKGKPWQVQGNVSTSKLVQVGDGQNVQLGAGPPPMAV